MNIEIVRIGLAQTTLSILLVPIVLLCSHGPEELNAVFRCRRADLEDVGHVHHHFDVLWLYVLSRLQFMRVVLITVLVPTR